MIDHGNEKSPQSTCVELVPLLRASGLMEIEQTDQLLP